MPTANVNQLRASGENLLDAVRNGALVRLRPVLMTALVASVGLVPLIVHGGIEAWRPEAGGAQETLSHPAC
jgi:Cu/Ag efflux pump CusA